MTAPVRVPHDGTTHTCGVELVGPTFPTSSEGGWDTCRETEWLAFCEDVDATAAADALRYLSASSQ